MTLVLLTILKFAGILVSGALGILGTVTQTHTKTGRLSRWGKWALRLTIAGLALAVCSQLAEEIERSKQAKEAKSRADAERSVLSRFDKLEVSDVVFELPITNAWVKNLAADLDRLGEQPRPFQTGLPEKRSAAFRVFRVNSAFNFNTSRPDPRLTDIWTNHQPLIRDLERFRILGVQINKDSPARKISDMPSPQSSDLLTVGGTATNNACDLYYSPRSHRLFFTGPSFGCSAEDWTFNGKVIGITDLTRATLTVWVSDLPPAEELVQAWVNRGRNPAPSPGSARGGEPSLLFGARLVRCNVGFGIHSCTLTNFASSTSPGRFSTVLPEVETILNFKAMSLNSTTFLDE